MLRGARRLWSEDRGNIGPITALLIVPIIGAMAMGTETSSWFMMQRAQQNAADSAALAAATNAGPNYLAEARGVAANYGYVNGVNGVTVTGINTAPCPGTPVVNTCYQVTVSRAAPIYLTRILYGGDTTLSGVPAKLVVAQSVAKPRALPTTYCMLGLAGTGNAFRINGGPNVDLTGCSIHSNSSMVCNGTDSHASYGDAVGTSNCGAVPRGNQDPITDPFLALQNEIPPNTCSSYPQANNQNVVPATNQISSISGTTKKYCGDVKLTQDITITQPNTIIAVYNGRFDLAGFKLSMAAGASATLMFSGTAQNGGSVTYHHYPVSSVNGGILDVAAPTSGNLKGVAIMQDRTRLTGSKNDKDFTYSGQNPELNITGLIYLPSANFTISGAIDHQTGGLGCLGVVAQTILVNGNGTIFNNPTSECPQAGLTLPTIPGSDARQSLVR